MCFRHPVERPNLRRHVFVRVKEDKGDLAMDEDTIDLYKGDVCIIRYDAIRGMLEDDTAELL